MNKPRALQKGDKVAIVAPAGPPDRENLSQGVEVLGKLGLEVVIGRHVFETQEDFVQERLSDLHEAFRDSEVRAVFCANGGYGTAKLAPDIDYKLIREHPKIFWGYSDITFLLTAIQKSSDLVTFHGPMIASDYNDVIRMKETVSSLDQLFSKESMTYDSQSSTLRTLVHGTGEGHITGGNLTLLTSGLGTPYQVEGKGAILLIEEVEEPAFLVDLKLHHLKQAGVFEEVEGVILGYFRGGADEGWKIKNVLREFFADASFPVVENFPFGHDQPNYGVPLGVKATLTTSPARLVVDSGVE